LDSNFDEVYERLKRTTNAVIDSWGNEGNKPIVLDKNRGSVHCAEWLREINPDFKMIVTVRDLRDIFTSIEKQHRKTLMLNHPDGMNHNIVDARASALFAENGIIGTPLKGIYNLGDIPNIMKNVFIWRYEDFILDPKKTTDIVFDFLGVDVCDIDFNNIVQSTNESDSYYNMKYIHKIKNSVEKPTSELPISPRILNHITNNKDLKWFYEQYYPETIEGKSSNAFCISANVTTTCSS